MASPSPLSAFQHLSEISDRASDTDASFWSPSNGKPHIPTHGASGTVLIKKLISASFSNFGFFLKGPGIFYIHVAHLAPQGRPRQCNAPVSRSAARSPWEP